MSTAAELIHAATAAADVLRSLYTDAIALGIRVTAWGPGSPTRAIYYGVARTLSTLTSSVEAIANQGFRSTATGDALTLNVKEVSGIERPGATYATTTVLISNTGGANYPFDARELVLLNTTAGKQYVNLAPVTIGPLASNVPVDIVAVEAGSDSTALPGEIDGYVTSLDGLSIPVQTNPAIGVDAMSDADLRAAGDARVGFVPTASTIGAGGAPGAYESVVRAGPDGKGGVLRADGTRISVTRVRVIDDGSGGVDVVVADEDGPIEVADLALVNSAVLGYATPVAVSAAAVNAAALSFSFTYEAFVPASSTALDADCIAAGNAAIVSYLQAVPIGGYELSPGVFSLPLGAVKRAIGNAIADVAGGTVDVEITVPLSSPGILNPAGVPVLSGTPSATITRVPGV